jgi:AAA+ ATPase superfamily predicted ATPase
MLLAPLFTFIYGRRRVGKTRLITHWLANRGIPGFYWLATDSAPGTLLRSLSQALYRQLHGQPPADPILSELKGVFVVNTPGGQQPAVCLPLDYLNGWLFKMDTSRVRPDIKEWHLNNLSI